MSDMYRMEVPQYGTLLQLVHDINQLAEAGAPGVVRTEEERARLAVERHGAIRLGTADELRTVGRMFRVMGMYPVGYYDLSAAGVPVHSTAFRPIEDESLRRNPFRVFTSLLRLDLIDDVELRAEAALILARRDIFTAAARKLLDQCEREGGLNEPDARRFVVELLQTFRWHSEATVDQQTYERLHKAHRLIADVVCFKGPHINHLTPRTLDIDAAQLEMPKRGIGAKENIEGPPPRRHPILLRQTSFRALEEPVNFGGGSEPGTHTARFGEIEQRGMALTHKGRALYDRLLALARHQSLASYADRLAANFKNFPDDLEEIRKQGLAFFRYEVSDTEAFEMTAGREAWDLEKLIAAGTVAASPITYEDFLPVSAAGIFRSNLGEAAPQAFGTAGSKPGFEAALGSAVFDELELYRLAQERSERSLREQYTGKVSA